MAKHVVDISSTLKNMKFMTRNSFPLSNSPAASSSPSIAPAQPLTTIDSPTTTNTEDIITSTDMIISPSMFIYATLHGRKSFQNFNKRYEKKFLDDPSLLQALDAPLPKKDDMRVLEEADMSVEDSRVYVSKKDRKANEKRKSTGGEGDDKRKKHGGKQKKSK